MTDKLNSQWKRISKNAGKFIVVDGLDGIGKGEIERALIEYEQRLGRSTFDSVSWSKAHQKGRPELKDFWDPPRVHYHTVITSEPTYTGIGADIRGELIASGGRRYSAEAQIQAYSLDRLIQMSRVVIPALESGVRVIQARCRASTDCYQMIVAEDERRNLEEIRHFINLQEGNLLQLEHRPDLLIIPTIADVSELIRRISERKDTQKDDKAIFENAAFQGRLKPLYESGWLREMFEKAGTKVAYLDAGISRDSSRSQAVAIYKHFLDTSEILPGYTRPKEK